MRRLRYVIARCPQQIEGGLIIGPTHNLQLDTPLENFWALVNTIQETAYQTMA